MTPQGTPSSVQPGASQRRRDLLGRTALCGMLVGVAALLSSPALAQLVQAGVPQVNAGGSAPNITLGSTESNIALHAERTLINWSTYTVGAGQSVKYTFDARNWIVLNRVLGTKVDISGVVEGRVAGAYGGNIWFAAPNGLIFRSGAKIDAGGILVTTGIPNSAGFLDPTNSTFNFTGIQDLPPPKITMQSGSSITGHGGLVALIAPAVVTEGGTSVTGLDGSSVLYGSTKDYQLHLAQGSPGDFDLVDFIISDASVGTLAEIALDLQNTTTANSVFVGVVSRSTAVSGVVNLQGMITANAAKTDGGDVILSGGGGILARAAGPSAGGTNTDFYLRNVSASRDIQLQNTGHVYGQPWLRPVTPSGPACGSACASPIPAAEPPLVMLQTAVDTTQVSNLIAGRDINLAAGQGISLGSAKATHNLTTDSTYLRANTLTVGGALSLTTETGDVGIGALTLAGDGQVRSKTALQIDSISLGGGKLDAQATTDLGVGVSGASNDATGGTILLTAGHNVSTDLGSGAFDTVTAVGVASLQADDLSATTVKAQQVLAHGGAVTLGTVTSKGDVYVSASGAATVKSATAGDDVYVLATGSASLGSANLTGSAADSLGPAFDGNPDTAGNGRVIAVQSAGGDAKLGLGSGAANGATKVIVKAGNDATVDLPTALPSVLQVAAGHDATLRGPSVSFESLDAGHSVILTATGGGLSSVHPLKANQDVVVTATGAVQLTDVTATGGSVTLTGLSVSAGAVSAGQDLTLKASSGDVKLTSFKAGEDLTVQGSNLSLGQQLAPIGRDFSITGLGDFSSTSNVSAGRNITVNAPGALKLADLSTSSGSITLAGKSVTAGAVAAAQDLTLKASSGDVKLTSFKAGEDLTVQGSNVSLGMQLAPIGRDLSITGLGDFSSTSNVSAGRNITVTAPGALQLADVETTSGSISLAGKSVTAGAVAAGQDLTLKASGGGVSLTSFKVGEDLTVQGSTLSLGKQLSGIGRDLSISSPGDFTADTDLTAGRSVILAIAGSATLKGVSGSGSVDITATDLAIGGSVSAPTVRIMAGDLALGGSISASTVQIESSNGALRVGGSGSEGAPASGMWLDNGEFSQIHATGAVNLFAGSSAGARGDLTLLTLDVNPQSTPQVNFFVGGGHTAFVQGVVAPTAPGGIVRIGDPGGTVWRPTSILVSGSLGASTYANGGYSNVRPFDEVRLYATQDIILGSSRFIDLVQSASEVDIGHNKPAGVAAIAGEQNHVMVTANLLEFSAPGKAVSQNTGPTPDQSVGLFLTGTASPKLILDPPSLVDIYGAYVSSAGVVITSFSAGGGLPILILDSSGNPIAQPADAIYRFNSCAVGTSQCSGASAITANLQQTGPAIMTATGEALGNDLGGTSESSSATSSSSGGGKTTRSANDRNAPPGLLGVAPVESDTLLIDPVVTGAGSEEIWRQRQRGAAPAQTPATTPAQAPAPAQSQPPATQP